MGAELGLTVELQNCHLGRNLRRGSTLRYVLTNKFYNERRNRRSKKFFMGRNLK